MQAINNVLKWSLYTAAVAMLMTMGGIFFFWAFIEVLEIMIYASD